MSTTSRTERGQPELHVAAGRLAEKRALSFGLAELAGTDRDLEPAQTGTQPELRIRIAVGVAGKLGSATAPSARDCFWLTDQIPADNSFWNSV
jgi:hypothetical protein